MHSGYIFTVRGADHVREVTVAEPIETLARELLAQHIDGPAAARRRATVSPQLARFLGLRRGDVLVWSPAN